MARGAGRGAGLRQVLRQCLVVAAMGTTIGLLGAALATRVVAAFLFDLSSAIRRRYRCRRAVAADDGCCRLRAGVAGGYGRSGPCHPPRMTFV
jgi:hypothetical protein